MGIRLTTWNVNGIRNPFGYQPWSRKRTFDAMFDILEADIVVMQELKIQRKDLKDDMVLVSGWDCFFSLPKHKKGYSGVGIYTRQSVCQPVRAEEGLLGGLCPPGSDVPYRDMPEGEAIGGYPTHSELLELGVDAAVLDSEGRCVVLEFPAFVLFGVYCPANTRGDEQGVAFRHAFWNALDLRIRKLDMLGKRVILTGDLNNVPNELDVAGAEDDKRKAGITHQDFVSTANRRIFNQMLESGEVYGRRDEGREKPVLTDVCRNFHQTRQAMYTHWDQKKNTRPGNFGSRIDFILASISMKSWFSASDIQEGLQGSDHCPVYAVMDDVVSSGSGPCHLLDIMNPPGVFRCGERLQSIATKATLAFSARLLPEFNLSQRQSIREMFKRSAATSLKAAIPETTPKQTSTPQQIVAASDKALEDSPLSRKSCESTVSPMITQKATTAKRKLEEANGSRPGKSKRASASNTSPAGANGTLKAFFRPAQASVSRDVGTTVADEVGAAAKTAALSETGDPAAPATHMSTTTDVHAPASKPALPSNHRTGAASVASSDTACAPAAPASASEDAGLGSSISRRIDSSEKWGELFRKAPPPRCEDHDEPCILLQTKVKTENQGRKFYICPRPLGPSGEKERKSQWRCRTYMWESDWRNVFLRGKR